MARKPKTIITRRNILIFTPILMFLVASFVVMGVFHYTISKLSIHPNNINVPDITVSEVVPPPFPIGVDPAKKVIVEKIDVEAYLINSLASNHRRRDGVNWLDRLALKLTTSPVFQQLASPISRTLVIFSGERKEEVIDNIGDILRWDESERLAFETLVASSSPALAEGKFFPSNYTVDKDADPQLVADLINKKLNDEVLVRYNDEIEKVVPLEDALIIASLLEREAYSFEDMRYISGVIWNRLFIGMNLQLDATLQYVKGEKLDQPWWPQVVPKDKYLESPYNTYEHEGLPPAPIANPSVDAILAALNPKVTDCLFYFHDDDNNFHCSKTYEEHVTALKKIYGRGK